MTTKAEWLALAERCENATGPDREIDGALFDALCVDGFKPSAEDLARVRQGNVDWLTHYTRSLDAITALIERDLPDCRWSAGCKGKHGLLPHGTIYAQNETGEDIYWYSAGANPALGLCAAFCLAMHEKESA